MNKTQQAARADKFYQRNVLNPYPSQSQSHTAYKKGFEEGYDVGYESAAGEFAEWCSENGWYFISGRGWFKNKTLIFEVTTPDLYQLWQQSL